MFELRVCVRAGVAEMSQWCRQVRVYGIPALNKELIQRVAGECGFEPQSMTDSVAIFRAAHTWRSWGEVFEVFISRVPEGYAVDVCSRSACRFTLVDFGKNERNVRAFFHTLDDLLDEDCACEIVGLCARCGYVLIDGNAEQCAECGAADFVKMLTTSWKARLTTGLYGVVVLTGVEYLFILAARHLGWAGLIGSGFLHPIYGGINLAVFNIVLIGILCLVHARTVQKDRRAVNDW